MTEHYYDEKRNFVRMEIEAQITFKIKGKNNLTHHGISHNLSATGLSMTTDCKLDEGNEIELVMNPSSDRLPPFVAEGKVLRVEKSTHDPAKFEVSVLLTKTI